MRVTCFNDLSEHVVLTVELRIEESLNDMLLSKMQLWIDTGTSNILTATVMEVFPWLLSNDNVGEIDVSTICCSVQNCL